MAKVKDIKYQYQLRAEEIALEKYDCEWDELPYGLQFKVYNEAMVEVTEALISQVDTMLDVMKERGDGK